eukprot:COSAG06_NODE_14224_length_1177_cov_1.802412_2_plen_197_part_00
MQKVHAAVFHARNACYVKQYMFRTETSTLPGKQNPSGRTTRGLVTSKAPASHAARLSPRPVIIRVAMRSTARGPLRPGARVHFAPRVARDRIRPRRLAFLGMGTQPRATRGGGRTPSMFPGARAWAGPSRRRRRRRPRCALLAAGRVGHASVASRKLVFRSSQKPMNIARRDGHTTLFHHQVASTAAAAWCATAFR